MFGIGISFFFLVPFIKYPESLSPLSLSLMSRYWIRLFLLKNLKTVCSLFSLFSAFSNHLYLYLSIKYFLNISVLKFQDISFQLFLFFIYKIKFSIFAQCFCIYKEIACKISIGIFSEHRVSKVMKGYNKSLNILNLG